MPLGVGEHGGDQAPYLLGLIMLGAGVPEPRQAPSVGCLVGACRLEEILKASPARTLGTLPGDPEHGGNRIVDEGRDQGDPSAITLAERSLRSVLGVRGAMPVTPAGAPALCRTASGEPGIRRKDASHAGHRSLVRIAAAAAGLKKESA